MKHLLILTATMIVFFALLLVILRFIGSRNTPTWATLNIDSCSHQRCSRDIALGKTTLEQARANIAADSAITIEYSMSNEAQLCWKPAIGHPYHTCVMSNSLSNTITSMTIFFDQGTFRFADAVDMFGGPIKLANCSGYTAYFQDNIDIWGRRSGNVDRLDPELPIDGISYYLSDPFLDDRPAWKGFTTLLDCTS